MNGDFWELNVAGWKNHYINGVLMGNHRAPGGVPRKNGKI
jgi:hypothetical protein